MLFDLRGRGRRRTVQTVYLGLALLMVVALVGLGLGGVGGSLFESLGKESGGGGGYAGKVASAEKRVKKHPTEASAWQSLTENLLHQADSSSEYRDSTTGAYTTKGKEELRKASNAWQEYLKLESKNPSVKVARSMINVYAEEALDEPSNLVAALQIVIASPGGGTEEHYALLAEYAYLAHDEGLGDLSSKKAVSLAPKAKQALLELELEKIKKEAKESASSTTTTSTSTTSTASTSKSSSKSSSK